MKKFILIVVIFVAAQLTISKSYAADKPVDYLALAGLLIQDGNYEKAESALANLNASDKEMDKALDKKRFYTLRGLIHLNLQRYSNAISEFNLAILSGQDKPFIYLYLAQANFGLGKYRTTISDLDRAGEAASKLPVAHLMRAHSYWNLKETDNAWQVLTNAETVFPENNTFTRQKIFFLLKLGLYQQVVETGNLYLVKYKAQAADYVAIGLGLLKAGEREKALLFLEKAGILFPGDGKAKLALAHAYAGNKQFNVAADLLTEVAIVNNKYVTDASELYRRAGRSMKALQIGMYSENEEKKLKQRLAIYLQAGLVDNIRALEDDLYRTGLIKKDDIRYALAYAMYRTGSYESAEEHLNKIRDSKIFRKAVSLRQAINECRVSLWKCY